MCPQICFSCLFPLSFMEWILFFSRFLQNKWTQWGNPGEWILRWFQCKFLYLTKCFFIATYRQLLFVTTYCLIGSEISMLFHNVNFVRGKNLYLNAFARDIFKYKPFLSKVVFFREEKPLKSRIKITHHIYICIIKKWCIHDYAFSGLIVSNISQGDPSRIEGSLYLMLLFSPGKPQIDGYFSVSCWQ